MKKLNILYSMQPSIGLPPEIINETLNEFSNSSNRNGGNPNNSIEITAFSNPDPLSSHILYLLNAEANISFRDSGVVRISLSMCFDGSNFPGLLNTILSSNISIIGPDPLILKS